MTQPTGRKALLVDYGGVLTHDLGSVLKAADSRSGLPAGTISRVIIDAYREPEGQSFVHRFERGELDRDGFRRELQGDLMANGFVLADTDILEDVLFGLRPDAESGMWALVRAARSHGVATGLLSNSWGTGGYPLELLRECFDDLVISGEVGLRKPDPAIFHLACERLEVAPADAIFVDDFEVNITAARALGMTAVLHAGNVEDTAGQLEDFLGVALR